MDPLDIIAKFYYKLNHAQALKWKGVNYLYELLALSIEDIIETYADEVR